MAFTGSNNALGWVHFRLRGGWRRSLIVAGGTFLMLGALIFTLVQLNEITRDRTDMLWGWTIGLLSLIAACLVLFIPGRIGTVIRADVQSKMIESHRLMPTPPAHAVAGYIMGSATQPLVFCSALFVLGALVASAVGVQPLRWSFACAVLLAFAGFTWVISAYASLGGRVGGGIMALMIAIPYLSQGYFLTLLPGTTVVLSPVIGQSVFDLRGVHVTLPATYAVAFAAQIYFGTLCFIAAARQYRNPTGISFDTVLAMCFLLGWVAISFTALRAWDDFRPRGWNPGNFETNVQVAASMITALLIAVTLVAANARERTKWQRQNAIRDPYPTHRPLPIAIVIAIATPAVLAIAFGPTSLPIRSSGVLYRSATIVIIALIGLYFFFAWTYSITKNAGMPAVIWLAIGWLLPIAIDLTEFAITGSGGAIRRFSGASPIGALMKLWTHGDTDINIGLGVQILLAIIPMSLWLIRFRPRRRSPAPDAAMAAAEMAGGYKPPRPR